MYKATKAIAKVNLYLSILGKRIDGFHEIESLMIPVDIYDEILYTVTEGDDIYLKVDSTDYQHLLCDYKENLVYKAAVILKTLYNVKKGVEITLKKNIPIGAGLGGGSSNAAETIKSLSKLWNINLSIKEMENIANMIGKDVPFFIHNKSMIVSGVGNILTPIVINLKFLIAIIYPNFCILTKDSYSCFQNKSNKSFNNIENLIKGIKTNNLDMILFNLYNEFEEHVLESYPLLCKIKNDITELNGNCLLCGSGSSMMTIIRNDRSDIINKLDNYCRQYKFKLMFCWNV